jgi:(p)ppGpp synthase/HD superfamily hydrolase
MIHDKPLPKLELAISFATAMHAGQLDKGGQPYIFHPLRVMMAAATLGLDEDHQVLGVLHDVIEDTDTTYATVGRLFGTAIAEDVYALSRRFIKVDHTGLAVVPVQFVHVNHVPEKEPYFDFIDHLVARSRARRIKLLDMADNMNPSRYVPGLSGLEGRYKKARVRIANAILQDPTPHDFMLLAHVGALNSVRFHDGRTDYELNRGWFTEA